MDRRGGGVMILVKRNIKYKRVQRVFDCNGKIEVCAVQIFVGGAFSHSIVLSSSAICGHFKKGVDQIFDSVWQQGFFRWRPERSL